MLYAEVTRLSGKIEILERGYDEVKAEHASCEKELNKVKHRLSILEPNK